MPAYNRQKIYPFLPLLIKLYQNTMKACCDCEPPQRGINKWFKVYFRSLKVLDSGRNIFIIIIKIMNKASIKPKQK